MQICWGLLGVNAEPWVPHSSQNADAFGVILPGDRMVLAVPALAVTSTAPSTCSGPEAHTILVSYRTNFEALVSSEEAIGTCAEISPTGTINCMKHVSDNIPLLQQTIRQMYAQ